MNVTEIVRDYQDQLRWFIRKRVASEEDAEDILQNIFYQLVKADKLLLPLNNVLAWLYKVARNQITDLWRKRKTVSYDAIGVDDEDNEAIEEIENLLFDDSDNPEDLYLRSVILEELETALAELPKEQREVFEMTEISGMSMKEISEKTGVPVNTLLSRKHYAVKHLRERLVELYDEVITS